MLKKDNIQNALHLLIWVVILFYPIFCVIELQKTKIKSVAYQYYNKGKKQCHEFKLSLALKNLTHAINVDSNFENSYLARARIFEILNKYVEAISDLTHAIKLSPDRADLFLQRGYLYLKNDNFKASLNDFNTSLNINKRNYEAYLGKASVYFKLGDFKKTAYYLETARTMNQSSPKVMSKQFQIRVAQKKATNLFQSGIKCFTNKDYKKAINRFDEALMIVPGASNVIFYRSMANMNLGNNDLALKDCSAAISLSHINSFDSSPQLYELFTYRGAIYSKKKMFSKAMDDFTKAIAINKEFALAYNNRGALFYLQLEKTKACNDLIKACKLGMCFQLEKMIQKGYCN